MLSSFLACCLAFSSLFSFFFPLLCPSVHLSVSLSIHLSISPYVCSSICLCIHLSVHPPGFNSVLWAGFSYGATAVCLLYVVFFSLVFDIYLPPQTVMVIVPDKRTKVYRWFSFHRYVHCFLIPAFLLQRSCIVRLKIPGGAGEWEMNPIVLGAFCSDFPKYWIWQQQHSKSTPRLPAIEGCKSERSLSSPPAVYMLMCCTLNTRKPGTCWGMLQFGTKRLQRLTASKWGFEVEGGVVMRASSPLCVVFYYFRLLISSCKANKAPWCSDLPQVIFIDRKG